MSFPNPRRQFADCGFKKRKADHSGSTLSVGTTLRSVKTWLIGGNGGKSHPAILAWEKSPLCRPALNPLYVSRPPGHAALSAGISFALPCFLSRSRHIATHPRSGTIWPKHLIFLADFTDFNGFGGWLDWFDVFFRSDEDDEVPEHGRTAERVAVVGACIGVWVPGSCSFQPKQLSVQARGKTCGPSQSSSCLKLFCGQWRHHRRSSSQLR